MSMRRTLATIVLIFSSAIAAGGPPTSVDSAEHLLQMNKLSVENDDLIKFILKRCTKEPATAEVSTAIQDLGSDDFQTREAGQKKLADLGAAIIPALSDVLKDANPERALRANEILNRIAKEWSAAEVSNFRAAIHVLCKRCPDGILPVFNRVLPLIAEDQLVEDVWAAIDALTIKAGQVDPIWEQSIKDSAPERRAISAYLLARRGTDSQRALARTMLTDKSAEVRLRAAQGLLGTGDFAGIIPRP
jgi:HEAT repeat protein